MKWILTTHNHSTLGAWTKIMIDIFGKPSSKTNKMNQQKYVLILNNCELSQEQHVTYVDLPWFTWAFNRPPFGTASCPRCPAYGCVLAFLILPLLQRRICGVFRPLPMALRMAPVKFTHFWGLIIPITELGFMIPGLISTPKTKFIRVLQPSYLLSSPIFMFTN